MMEKLAMVLAARRALRRVAFAFLVAAGAALVTASTAHAGWGGPLDMEPYLYRYGGWRLPW